MAGGAGRRHGGSGAEIARREGCSGNRVSQILHLLKLAPEILAWVKALPPGTPARKVTERMLRGVARMPPAKQVGAVEKLWPAALWRGEVAVEKQSRRR